MSGGADVYEGRAYNRVYRQHQDAGVPVLEFTVWLETGPDDLPTLYGYGYI